MTDFDVQLGGFGNNILQAKKHNKHRKRHSSSPGGDVLPALEIFSNHKRAKKLAEESIGITVDELASQDEARGMSMSSSHVAGLIVLAWLVLSTFCCRLIFQWNYVDCFYFTVVTFTTVGYGDLVPTSDAQKMFTTVYVLFSVIIIGFAFGLFFSDLTSAEEQRQQDLRLAIIADDSWLDDEEGRNRAKIIRDGKKQCFCFSSTAMNPTSPDERSVKIALLILFLCILTGTVIALYEGYSVIDGIYFSIVSASTVGYGDDVPRSNEAKIFDCIFIMFGCASLAWAATNVACIPLIRRSQKRQAKVLHQYGRHLEREELKKLASGGEDPRYCTRSEFVVRMLLALQMVQAHEVEMCERSFDRYDSSNDGKLSVADL